MNMQLRASLRVLKKIPPMSMAMSTMMSVPMEQNISSSGFWAVALNRKKPMTPGTAQINTIPASFSIPPIISIRKNSAKLLKIKEIADFALSI